ncbi:GntR family transcriptional regulator [Nocardioides ferulae]|uniref:GntR family transcriptional regulator n=1 Tax=Nocardioides ferulae TaxID=2340821 RepID=UPI001981892F|nr:GntR family transcriptional regulator [Nocardioides ferulae]
MSAQHLRQSTPRYVGIATELRERILDQQLAPHTLMPSERELSEQFAVSRMTARQALTLLESEGHVYRRPPRGTFVAEPRVRFQIGSFSEEANRLGRDASAQLLWAKALVGPGNGATAARAALGLAADDVIHAFRRLRLMEGEPLAIETTYFPASLTPGILDVEVHGSLWQLLRGRYDLRLERSKAVLESIVLDEGACERLAVRAASNGILLTRTTVDDQGRCVEYARDVYRADRAAFEVTASVAR